MVNKADFLILGGSAAGTTAAETIRSLQPESSIVIITDENHEQYSRVLVPHYVRGKVAREQVFLKKPEWYSEKKIVLLKGNRAVSLDAKSKKLKISNGIEIEYGKLLITIGGHVIPFRVKGVENANILYLRTIEDADKIIAESKNAKKALIIGGGFIGLEFASCFKLNGISDITLLVREPYFWSSKLDEDSSKALVGVLERNGIKISYQEEVSEIRDGDGDAKNIIVTKSGKEYPTDVIGVGIGIKGDFEFLEGSGVVTDKGIITNEYLETNVPDIYAAGDCAQFHDVIFDRQHVVGNWANATSQGAAVGKTMGGQRTVFETASSYTISFFDGNCSFIGVTDSDFADEIITRGSSSEGKVTRILVKKYQDIIRIVGATVINSPADVGPLTMAIKSKKNIMAIKEKLNDINFPLQGLSG